MHTNPRRKSFHIKLYAIGISSQLLSLFWLPQLLMQANLNPWPLQILLLSFGLLGFMIWRGIYAAPERRVPNILWCSLIFPSLIWQAWCAFNLPIALCYILWFLFHQLIVPLQSQIESSLAYVQNYNSNIFNLISISTGLLALYGSIIRRKQVAIMAIAVPIPKLPLAFKGYRVAHLSDIHVSNFTSSSWLEHQVKTINTLKPDLIVITGDILTVGNEFISEAAHTLGQLRAKDGVILTTGNHDYFCNTKLFLQQMHAVGIHTLHNEPLEIQRGKDIISILGIDGVVDNLEAQEILIKRAVSKRKENTCTILLGHEPSIFELAEQYNIDLTLSGHTHGGQISLPYFSQLNPARLTYRFSAGLYHRGPYHLYVNRGLGTVGLPIRIGAAPEVALITLQVAE